MGSDTILVPKVFKKLVEYIQTDLKQEGLFRREGSKAKQQKLVVISLFLLLDTKPRA